VIRRINEPGRNFYALARKRDLGGIEKKKEKSLREARADLLYNRMNMASTTHRMLSCLKSKETQ
jgi:hypothetical protein